jgi:hypothetical protein
MGHPHKGKLSISRGGVLSIDRTRCHIHTKPPELRGVTVVPKFIRDMISGKRYGRMSESEKKRMRNFRKQAKKKLPGLENMSLHRVGKTIAKLMKRQQEK